MPEYPDLPAGTGWALVDTATGLFDSSAVMAALDARYIPGDIHFTYQRTAAYNFTTTPGTAVDWSAGVVDGALAGFSTADDITFTCTEEGLYTVDVLITAGNTAGAVVCDVYKNGSVRRTQLLTSTTTTSTSLRVSYTTRFEVGDTFKVHARASTTIAATVSEQANFLTVTRLRP